MSTNYSGTPGNITPGAAVLIVEPADGESRNVASINPALSKLADMVQYAYEQIIAMAVGNLTKRDTGQAGVVAELKRHSSGLWTACAAGGLLSTSPDGINWTARTLTAIGTGTPQSVTWNGTTYVAVCTTDGTAGRIFTSTDGITWTSRTSNAGNNSLNKVEWNGSVWAACGDNLTICTSPDGTTWTKQTVTGTAAHFKGIGWNGSAWCAIETRELAWTSSNGTTWTSNLVEGTAVALTFASLAFGAGLFVIATDDGIFTSPTGVTWTSRLGTAWAGGVKWNGRFFMVCSPGGAIRTSLDGLAWSAANAQHNLFNNGATQIANNSLAADTSSGVFAVALSGGNGFGVHSLISPVTR